MDRARSAARLNSETSFTAARVYSGLGRGVSLFLRHLLLADVFDDSLRRAPDPAGLFITHPRRTRRRRLSWAVCITGSTRASKMGAHGNPAGAYLLDGTRMGSSRGDGPALERARLLASLPQLSDRAGLVGRRLRRQLST